jgi:hypothetical protein
MVFVVCGLVEHCERLIDIAIILSIHVRSSPLLRNIVSKNLNFAEKITCLQERHQLVLNAPLHLQLLNGLRCRCRAASLCQQRLLVGNAFGGAPFVVAAHGLVWFDAMSLNCATSRACRIPRCQRLCCFGFGTWTVNSGPIHLPQVVMTLETFKRALSRRIYPLISVSMLRGKAGRLKTLTNLFHSSSDFLASRKAAPR